MISEKALAEFYEESAKASGNPKATANWLLSELVRELNNAGKSAVNSPVTAANLAELVCFVDEEKISGKQGKEVLIAMFAEGKSAADVVKEKGLEQVSDSGAIEKIIDEVIAANAAQVAAYRGGKESLFGFFVGQVMKASKGTANPKVVNEVLKTKLAG